MQHNIRQFTERDCAFIVAIDNRNLSPERRYTVADWVAEDAERGPDEAALRIVVGDPAIAFLEVRDMGTTPPSFRSVPGICELTLLVAHKHRRQGLGSMLYEHAVQYAYQRHACLLRCWFYQYGDDNSTVSFLEQRGFREQARRQTSHLNIPTFDPDDYDRLMQRMAQQDVRFVLYADLPDTQAHRRKLFDLYVATTFQQADALFAAWQHAYLKHVDWSSEALLIAEVNGQWVGLTRTRVYNRETGAAKITATGTVLRFRGNGIATALKVQAVELIRERGGTIILTSNRVDNVEMLAINRKLGYILGPLELTYDCVLPTAEHTP